MEDATPVRAGVALKRKALILDRDGTISQEVGYLDRADRVRLIEGSAEAVRRANEAGFQTIVATNQSGVARGLFTEDAVAEVHDRLRELLAADGARIDAFYYCPHHPEPGADGSSRECDCRKPKAGMLRRASREMGIDLRSSYMIGDSMRDIEAGHEAGATTVLVLTGFGRRQLDRDSEWTVRPDHVARNLREAVEWILNRRAGGARTGPGSVE